MKKVKTMKVLSQKKIVFRAQKQEKLWIARGTCQTIALGDNLIIFL